jgi:hypothetical protein
MKMREIINLVEAEQPRAKASSLPINLVALKAEVQTLVSVFAREPFAIKFDRAIQQAMLDHAKQTVQEIKADDPASRYTIADVLEDSMVRIWSRNNIPFYQIRSDAEHEEHAPLSYHDRNAERFGTDDQGSVVEDSAYLRGLHAQVNAANTLGHLDIAKLSDVQKALNTLKSFAQTFNREYDYNDGGEQPPLLESMTTIIGLLIPVLLLRCSVSS